MDHDFSAKAAPFVIRPLSAPVCTVSSIAASINFIEIKSYTWATYVRVNVLLSSRVSAVVTNGTLPYGLAKHIHAYAHITRTSFLKRLLSAALDVCTSSTRAKKV